MTLALRIDRVDRLDDGSLAVIDYKTGADAEPDAWLGERPRLPQLPLYAEALGMDQVSAVAFGRVRTGDTGYCGLARDSTLFPGLKSPAARGWPRRVCVVAGTAARRGAAGSRRSRTSMRRETRGSRRTRRMPASTAISAALCRISETRLRTAAEASGDD